jgi:hypothetical protein
MEEDLTLAPSRRTRRLAALIIGGAALLAVGFVVLLALLPGLGERAEPSIYTVTFPEGSTFSIDPDVFAGVPNRSVGSVVWLELEVGDTLLVRNEDVFNHTLWAITVRPGESVGHTFTEVGTFSGECTFDLTVFIEVR